MKKFDYSNLADVDRISWRIDELRKNLSGSDPTFLAFNTASEWEARSETGDCFHLPLWRRPLVMSYPDWIARKMPSGEVVSSMELTTCSWFSTRNASASPP